MQQSIDFFSKMGIKRQSLFILTIEAIWLKKRAKFLLIHLKMLWHFKKYSIAGIKRNNAHLT